MKNQEFFEILRQVVRKPNATQRELAQQLNLSLGKLNYCLKALREKGLVKLKNFKTNPNKLNYAYVLTPKGVAEKTRLTVNFMARKMKEYNELKKDLERNKKE